MVELCIHLANILYLLSYLSRDMLWLRVLTCLGLLLGVVFFSCQATPLHGPTAWHVVFLLINLAQVRRLVVERRQLMLTAEQERFCSTAFEDYTREELLTLLTRTMCRQPDRGADGQHSLPRGLTEEERSLRDIALSRLARKELLILLTRRLWNSLLRWCPPGRR